MCDSGAAMERRRARHAALLSLLAIPIAACGDDDGGGDGPVDTREACADRNPLRNVYWGDLHVHTRFSFDAYLNDVRGTPADAYAYAKGAPITLPDETGAQTIEVQIDRPLDFAAVTDHAEYLGEVSACSDPSSPVYDGQFCTDFRSDPDNALVRVGGNLNLPDPMRFDVCDDFDCLARAEDAWRREQEAAEAAYDRTSACTFTSFVAYEWSSARGLSNLHRNVLFRSARVPTLPTSYYEENEPEGLWAALRRDCLDGLPGCDVMSIPHNTNWSNGNMFVPEYPEGVDEAEFARERAELEPLLEMFQHKGDSECENGLGGVLGDVDELCRFEKLRDPPFPDCGDGTGAGGTINVGCVSRLDFLRGILLEGLREEARIGVNPYPLGVIASTDTHNATPGAVQESDYVGHFGSLETDLLVRLTIDVPGGPRANPGGLVAVWAEENSREAIFDAMRRKETYGTSGPRIGVRFFGGHDLPEDLCDRADLVETGYADGVPMGGALPAPDGDAAPRFAVLATRDPGTERFPGSPLQRAQIIKGWIDGEGQSRVEVVDVAGGENGATVNPDTCEPEGEGADTLCTVWTDPDFDPSERAYYYVRVLENPVCRWSARACQLIPPDDTSDRAERARANCENLPTTIQERAWTSPIFYSP